MRLTTPRKAQASSGKLRHTRAQEPSPSFTRRRIPQEPVRFNGALARLSFSVVLMSSMTSTLGERLTAHVVRLAPAAFRFHAHLGRPPLSTLGLRSPSAIATSCLSIPRAPMQTPRFWLAGQRISQNEGVCEPPKSASAAEPPTTPSPGVSSQFFTRFRPTMSKSLRMPSASLSF